MWAFMDDDLQAVSNIQTVVRAIVSLGMSGVILYIFLLQRQDHKEAMHMNRKMLWAILKMIRRDYVKPSDKPQPSDDKKMP